MAHDSWYERLEAYLDEELDQTAATAFESETAADPQLQAELTARRRFREEARRALAGDLPDGLSRDLARDLAGLAREPHRRPSPIERIRRDRRRWLLALAAGLTVAILAPQLLRNDHGAEGPRSSISMNGPVTVLRFGEEPQATTELEASCFDLSAGACR